MHISWKLMKLYFAAFTILPAKADPIPWSGSYATEIHNHWRDWSPDTSFHTVGSDGFRNATERWTTYQQPTYRAAVSPATERDLIKTAKFATHMRIPFLATGGRHGYTTTLGRLQNGLAIDMSKLNSFHLDSDTGSFTIGPGVTFGDIFEPLFSAGFDIQTGSAPCPSVIGVTLGGGAGRYQGTYGLLIDALVSVRLLTANGNVVNVSKTENPDLFWAIRGAGANFGIVTSATYQARRLTDDGDNFVGFYRVPAGREAEYFQLLESLPPLDARLSSFMLINFNQTSNETYTQIQWVYKGQEAAAREVLKPIHDFGLIVDGEAVQKWNTLITGTPGIEQVCANNKYQNNYGWNIKRYNASSFTKSFDMMQKFFQDYPSARSSNLQFELFPNQAMAAVPKEETAFAWRESRGQIHPNIVLADKDPKIDAATDCFANKLRSMMVADAGFGGEIAVFSTFAHGDEPLERIYGKENLPRLADLKRKWDPEEVFGWNNAIPLKYP